MTESSGQLMEVNLDAETAAALAAARDRMNRDQFEAGASAARAGRPIDESQSPAWRKGHASVTGPDVGPASAGT